MATLKHDMEKGGYLFNLDKKTLADASNYGRNSQFNSTTEYNRKVYCYYKTPNY